MLLEFFKKAKATGLFFVCFIFEMNICSVLVSAFKYSPEKSGNGRTRLYLLVDPTSSLIGEQLFVLDHNNEINAATTVYYKTQFKQILFI